MNCLVGCGGCGGLRLLPDTRSALTRRGTERVKEGERELGAEEEGRWMGDGSWEGGPCGGS
jgi:hypothetical protein